MQPAKQACRARPPGRCAVLALALLCAVGTALRGGETPPAKEFQVKAVFLFNFLQFVEWPAGAFEGPDTPYRIGVLGEDPFREALDEAVRGETVRNRPIVIERYARAADLKPCHLLYVGTSARAELPQILTRCRGQPVLTISDLADFAQRGGVINFYADGAKIRFEINRAAAQRHGLKLNSQLLSLARIVGQNPPGPLYAP